MDFNELLKRRIQSTYIIKTRSGLDSQSIINNLSSQLYNFMTKKQGFSSANISRGMRDIVIEEYRESVTLSLLNLYLDCIQNNDNLTNEQDITIKNMLKSSSDINNIANTILKNNDMIHRLRKSSN